MQLYTRSSVLLALVMVLVGCGQPDAEQLTGPQVRPVKLHEVTDPTATSIRRFPGTVEANQTADLTFRVGGELAQLTARPGQRVTAGQVIAKLEPTDYQLALEQAEAQAELAEAQFTRLEQLYARDTISQQALDEARAELRVARANRDTAATNLEYTRLKAPFDGVVANLHVEPYENVAPQEPILTLQVDQLIDISIRVPERLFSRVRRDTNYQPDVMFDTLPGQVFSARIREWERIPDPATNTYRVVFSMPAPAQANILPGMTAQVLVDSGALLPGLPGLVTIPVGALFNPPQEENRQASYVWVYTADDEHAGATGTVALRRVTMHELTAAEALIVHGLKPGEQVVTAGTQQLQQGLRVRPWVRERGL